MRIGASVTCIRYCMCDRGARWRRDVGHRRTRPGQVGRKASQFMQSEKRTRCYTLGWTYKKFSWKSTCPVITIVYTCAAFYRTIYELYFGLCSPGDNKIRTPTPQCVATLVLFVRTKSCKCRPVPLTLVPPGEWQAKLKNEFRTQKVLPVRPTGNCNFDRSPCSS